MELHSHNLVEHTYTDILYELRPAKDLQGNKVKGLFNAWIIINNPSQYNSYTTKAVKEIILAFREASNDRSVVAVVFTAAGDKAFCTGGNTKEYAEYYAGNPQEYKQYMRLFNDMVSAILMCDKPVICRVNGMRIGGGQEIGMACDYSIAQDLARFGLRVASCGLRVARPCGFRVEGLRSCGLRVAGCGLRVAGCELRVAGCGLRRPSRFPKP
jgi:6-oxo-cyclohex-1-ene-carbonyl-CoA hydrolase